MKQVFKEQLVEFNNKVKPQNQEVTSKAAPAALVTKDTAKASKSKMI